MITATPSSPRSAHCRTILFSLGCALAVVALSAPALRAADEAAPQAPAEKAPALPVTASFEKGTPGERGGPWVLNVKNDSKDELKVNARILFSVAFHMGSKTWDLPPHVIGAGETWSIPDLASGDKITLTAEGYAPLDLVVK